MRAPVRLWRVVHWRRYRRLRRLAARSTDSFSVDVLAVHQPSPAGRPFRTARLVVPSVSGSSPAVAVTLFRRQRPNDLGGPERVTLLGSRDGLGPVVVSVAGQPPRLGLGLPFDPAKPTMRDRIGTAARFVVGIPGRLFTALTTEVRGLLHGLPKLGGWVLATGRRAGLALVAGIKAAVVGAPRFLWLLLSTPLKLVVSTVRALGRRARWLVQSTLRVLAALPGLARTALTAAVVVARAASRLFGATVRFVPRAVGIAATLVVRAAVRGVLVVWATPRGLVGLARFVVRALGWLATGLVRLLRGLVINVGVLRAACGAGARRMVGALVGLARRVPGWIGTAIRLATRVGARSFIWVLRLPARIGRALIGVPRLCGLAVRQLGAGLHRVFGVVGSLRQRLAATGPFGAYLGLAALALVAGAAFTVAALLAGPGDNFVVRTLLFLSLSATAGSGVWLARRVYLLREFRQLENSAAAVPVTVMWYEATTGRARLLRSGTIALRLGDRTADPVAIVALLPRLRARIPTQGTHTLLRTKPGGAEGVVVLGRHPDQALGIARVFGPYRLDGPDVVQQVRRLTRRRLRPAGWSLSVALGITVLVGWLAGDASAGTLWGGLLAVVAVVSFGHRMVERRSFEQLLHRGCHTGAAEVVGLVGRPRWVRGWFHHDELWLQLRDGSGEYLRVPLFGRQNPSVLLPGDTARVYWRDGRATHIVIVGPSGATLLGSYETWSPGVAPAGALPGRVAA